MWLSKRKSIKNFRNGISAGFLLISVSTFAQPDLEYKRMVAQYPGEHAVILKDQEKVFIDIDKEKLSIRQDRYTESMYLDNLAGMFSEYHIDYSEFGKITKIEAATQVPQKNKYTEVKVKDFTYKDKISESVFYDGTQSVSFLYPALKPGAKSWLSYSKEISEPRLLPSYFFQRGIPVKESEFIITASDDVELGWKMFNIPDSIVTFTKTKEKNNKTTYTWKIKNVGKHKSEQDSPDARYYSPHIITWIKSYKINGQTYSMLGTVRDLYSWYYSLVKEANKEDSPELKAIVDSIVTNVSSEPEKVKRIFYWVQDHIKYIAIEDGMGGFVPRSGKTVCAKRYGDCKDMASIIYKMLEYAGIKSYLTWIGSRDIPYTYEEVSTPSVDNHMICTYIHDGAYYFLDATGQHIPFGMPTSFIQGKEALIGIDGEKFEVRKVPIVPLEKNILYDSVKISIDGNKIVGTGSSRLTGFYKINTTHSLLRAGKDYSKFLRSYYNKGNNKFLLDTASYLNLNNKDLPLIVNYSFNIQDYIKQHDNEIYINMHLSKEMQNEAIKNDRQQDIENEFNGVTVNVVTLTIPNGYKVSYIPPRSEYKNEKYGFEIEYKQTGKTITLTQKNYSNVLLLQKNDFEEWNQMIKELNKAYSEVVVLKK